MKRGTRPHLTLESDFDPLLSSQIYDKAHFRRAATGEERMAWRYLERNILDVCQGTVEERLAYIADLMDWMEAGDDAPYSFNYWCSLLGIEENWMEDNFWAFLVLQGRNARNGIRGDFKIFRKIQAVRIEQPHMLSKVAQREEHEASIVSHDLYRCLSCSHTGDMKHFEGYTCVRGQAQPAEASVGLETQKEIHEKGNSQPLNVGDIDSVQDQSYRPDHELDNWASDGGRTDASGTGSASGVGTVAVGPAPTGSSADV